MYNLTNVTESTNIYEFIIELDQEAGGLIGVFLVACLFFVLFMSMKRVEQDTKEVFLTSSTITVIISIVFWSIELISWKILSIPVILVFAAIMIYKFS